MFELPSLWNIIFSTLIFFLAAWYIRRWLDEHEIPAGMTRSLLVFVLASIVSWAAGNLEEKLHGNSPAVHHATQTSYNLLQ